MVGGKSVGFSRFGRAAVMSVSAKAERAAGTAELRFRRIMRRGVALFHTANVQSAGTDEPSSGAGVAAKPFEAIRAFIVEMSEGW